MSMMKILMLSTLSSVFVISAAMAADSGNVAPTGDDGGHHDRKALRCRFEGPKGTECIARIVIREEDQHPSSTLDDGGDRRRARLSVSCGGTEIYNDGGRVFDRDDLTIVSAIPAPPAVAFERRDDHDRDDNEVRAWLSLGDDTRLPGRCEFLLLGDDGI